jgi:hypothetical protein
MRLIFLFLVIAMLPMRAWLGDVAAMQMVTTPASNMEIAANNINPIEADGTLSFNAEAVKRPCHDAASAAGHPADLTTLTGPATYGNCVQCSTCQGCHSVALAPIMHPLPMLALPRQLVHSDHALFASVPRAPHLKPPIF